MTRHNRLQSEPNIWLATARPNCRPHLVPIWFVWVDENFYICTERSSVKVRNLLTNPLASVSLENGTQPVVAECHATLVEAPYPSDVVQAFQAKYDWDIRSDRQYNVVVALEPKRWLMG